MPSSIRLPFFAGLVIHPALVLGRVTVILLPPLAAPRIGVAAVVAAIAAVCVLLIAVTMAPESG
ncbi:hypothetical protein [Sphaerisporangium perillae]|uniref:hypothetical protein n=1 Tax=Sphaerisporangium perillae TaxID=2935860 RepID=UPI00200BCD93|nr:hypothetical protein [Sphaerisporangium perillae]